MAGDEWRGMEEPEVGPSWCAGLWGRESPYLSFC